MLIGLLRFNEQPASRDRVAIMQIKERGHKAVFFNYDGIDYKTKSINGKTLKTGKWIKVTTRFPDVVYNDLAPIHRMDPRIYERLEKQGIPFTTHRINTDLQQYPTLQKHISPRQSLKNFLELRLLLEEHCDIELLANEPFSINSLHLLENGKIEVRLTDGDKQLFNMAGLEQKLGNRDVLAKFYVQPQLASSPCTIRSYVGRTANGAWCNVFHYASVHQSGLTAFSYIMEFLRANYGGRAKAIHERLSKLGIAIVEAIQANYDFEIDALGLDFRIHSDGELRLHAVHTFPSMRPFEAIAEHHMVQFAIYLGSKS